MCLLRTAPGQQQRSDGLPERGNREEQSCSGSHPDHYHLFNRQPGSNIRGSVATVEYLPGHLVLGVLQVVPQAPDFGSVGQQAPGSLGAGGKAPV